MQYYIIGTGNTAWFLCTRLAKAGYTCRGIYGRKKENATTLADKIKAPVLENLEEIKDDADCCIIAVTDSAIKGIAEQLSFEQMVVIHTAGSVSRKVLDTTSKHNGILWPVYSIVKESLPLGRSVPVVMEGSNEHAARILLNITSVLTDIYYNVSWEQRQWLHLCAVLSNNFVNHLMAISEKICTKQKVPFSLLYPIVMQTSDRIRTTSPYELQTGPAKRGDVNTVTTHLDMLSTKEEWQRLYESITTSIEKMYNPNTGEPKHNP